MTVRTLAGLFQSERPALERALGDDPGTVRALTRVRGILEQLPARYTAAAAQTGGAVQEDELKRVADLVEIVRASLGAVSAVSAVPAADPAAPPWSAAGPDRPEGGPDRLVRRFASYLRGRPGNDEAAYTQYGRDTPGYAAPVAPGNVPPAVTLSVRTTHLLDTVEAALEAIDRALIPAGRGVPYGGSVPLSSPDSGGSDGWAGNPRLLDLAQDLLAARVTGSPATAMTRIEHLEEDLRVREGIGVLRFDPADRETAGMFDILPVPAGFPSEFVTRRPALVQSGTVLRRGEVRGPASGTARRDPAGSPGNSSKNGERD